MCEPTTIIMVGAAVIGAYATYESGQTEERFAKQEAAQGVADAQAEKGDAQVEADRIRRMKQAALAETNVAIAGSGQNLASAGALQLNKEVSRGAEEDAFNALIGGTNRSARVNQQASVTAARGKAAARGATFSAFGQLASAGGQAYGGWVSGNKPMTNSKGNVTRNYIGARPGKG